MGKEADMTPGSKLTMNLMFSCFGVSFKRDINGDCSDEIATDEERNRSNKGKKDNKKSKNEKRRGRRRWLSSPRLWLERPAGVSRTVPVDAATPLDIVVVSVDKEEGVTRSGSSEVSSSSGQKPGKIRVRTESNATKDEESSVPCRTPPRLFRGRDDDHTEGCPETSNVIEDRTVDRIHRHDVESPKNDRWQRRRSFYQGIVTASGGSTAKEHDEAPPSPGSSYENMMGLSIIVATGLIMLVWGRVCAILFTCAWLFIVPYYSKGPARHRHGPAPAKADVFSKEYKEKVVLEGLLARNRRPPR